MLCPARPGCRWRACSGQIWPRSVRSRAASRESDRAVQKRKNNREKSRGDFHKGVKFLQWGFVYEVNYNYTDETARRRALHFAVFVIGHSLSHKKAQMGF